MLSIGAMKSGQANYYQKLAQEDYYLNGGEPPGKWLGKGAERLGLMGQVESEQLRNVFEGFDSQDRKLVQNAGKDNRQPGWDLTFSAPKSVSVLWSQGTRAEQMATQDAHDAAVQSTLRFIEEHFAFSRLGKRGAEQVSADLVIAAFEHSCSRALDPQLHTHCLVMNLGVDELGAVRSILSRPLYEAKMLAGAFYRCQLGHELKLRLGVELERPTDDKGRPQSWFEIKGISGELLKHFSKRRAAIEAELGKRGLESASAAAFATLSTREGKELVPPRHQLQESWRKEAAELGAEFPHFAVGGSVPSPTAAEAVCKAALAKVVAEITYGENTFTKKEAALRTLEAAQAIGIDAADVLQVIQQELKTNSEYISLGVRNGVERWTTKEILRLEQKFLEAVSTLNERRFEPVSDAVANVAASSARQAANGSTFTLDAEQQAAVRYIAQGRESIKVVTGFAGTGKTDMLQAAKEALEAHGYEVIGAALAGIAARTLEDKAGIKSETIRRREYQLQPTAAQKLRHHARQLVRAAQGKSTHRLQPLTLGPKTVLVIDEAGMVGTRDFTLLVKAVVEQGGSVVAVGDQWQLPSIERGGCLAELVRKVDGVHLSEIRRQTDEADREAVKELARGNPEAALLHYSSKGQLCVAATRAQAEHELLADWSHHGGTQSPAEHKIFAGTRAEVDRLNRLAQWERIKSGEVSASERVEHDGQTFMVGDRVRFNKSLRTRGIEKGRGGTVIAAKDGMTGKYVAVSLGDDQSSLSERALVALKHHAKQLIQAALGKKTERFPPRRDIILVPLKSVNPLAKTYDGLSLDYAMTTHLGQGQTVANSYVLLGGRMGDRELSYVQGSRHKEALRLYTSEVEAGRQITDAARLTRPVNEDFRNTADEIPEYSSLVMQMKLSRAKELASEFRGTPTLTHGEHPYAH